MPSFLRTLALFFERETQQLSRASSGLKRLFARVSSPRRAGPAGSRIAAPPPPSAPPPPPRRFEPKAEPAKHRLSVLRGPLAYAASILGHGLLLWAIYRTPRPEPPDRDRGGFAIPIRVRLVRVPPLPEAVVGADSPPVIPSAEPFPIRGNTLKELLNSSTLPPGPEVEPTSAPAPELDRKPKPPAARPGPADPAPPLPIGLGAGTPPLPSGSGGRGGTSPYSGRLDSRGKGTALGVYGGNGKTEGAVSRGLRWLAEHQDQDGGWSADAFERHCRHGVPCGGKGLTEFNAGITALTVLAFLGAGHLPEPPRGPLRGARIPLTVAADMEFQPYRRNVEKALDYLLARQDGSGAFGATGESYFYNHAIATFALGEAYALTGSQKYKESTLAAIRFSVNAQQAGGGWDYTSRSTGRNDLSITGWQIMALRTALNAGLEVPDGTLARASRFLERAVTPDGDGLYADLGQEAGRRGINMVAVGLLSRLYLGALPADEKSRHAAERILRTPPDWAAVEGWERTFQSYYYWYVATLSLFHLQGPGWKAWNVFLQRAVLPLQSQKGHEDGSWPPEGNWLGISGGRVYATAINVLTLETYYRYEPLFKPRKS